jgi:hypothetical protein
MKKIALFVFNGDPMCFIHVLLNALDMKKRGYEPRIVIEGAAVKLIPELEKEDNPLHMLWDKVLGEGLVDGVCKACAAKLGTLSEIESQNLPILDDMLGHPGMAGYMERGYQVISF